MKTVLITGGSRGIGAETAIEFAKSGYNVIVNYFNSKDLALKIVEKCKTYGVKSVGAFADISNMAQVKEMVSTAESNFGMIDILINNSGISQQKLFTNITQNDWAKMLAVNLTGVFNCSQAVLPKMIINHTGRIINISSMWGQTGGSCEVHYSAAKSGVIGMTKALSKEVAPSGITVNCICPGVIMTDMISDLDN
ncbi:MAG: SDR family NAD(P)-dependent oxidoreductase, partial [Oscillospiraceae bacterium]